jgi:hypothetical protein
MFSTTRTDDTANTDPGTTHAVQAFRNRPTRRSRPPVPRRRDGQQKLRLPPGRLRGLVEDWLRDHASDEFSPSAIGKALHRSSGAVANALDKLVADGYATQTCDKPKRFTAAKTIPEPVTH